VRAAPYPSSFNWVDLHAVSPVKTQGDGETCWSFSAAGAIEGLQVVQQHGPVRSLSNQQLIDCVPKQCTQSDGTMRDAFQWVKAHGIDFDRNYPYIDQNCTFWDLPHECKDLNYPVHISG